MNYLVLTDSVLHFVCVYDKDFNIVFAAEQLFYNKPYEVIVDLISNL